MSDDQMDPLEWCCKELAECSRLHVKKDDLIAALEAELAEARKDSARLTYAIERSNAGEGWFCDSMWDEATALCPVNYEEADNVQKWIRAAIDARMEAQCAGDW